MQATDEKDQRIKQLEVENQKLQAKVVQLEHNVEALTQAVLHAAKQRFGASSEKTPSVEGQLFLFEDDAMKDTNQSNTNIIQIREHKRPIRKKGDREKLTMGLETVVEEVTLEGEDIFCGICGHELKIIGKKTVRSEMEYIPAKLQLKKYIQTVYKCPDCGLNDEHPNAVIRSSVIPKPVLTHSVASASCVAWIMYQKYAVSVPLHRQERDFKRMGAELKRDMMAYWLIQSTQYWLKPLYDRMHLKLLEYEVIMSDETTWQVNREKGRKASSKSYIWVHRNGPGEDIGIILYVYTATRSGDHARNFLSGFHGFHVSDAYEGYEKVEGTTRCLCFSHLRRYFIDAIPLDSKKKELPGSGGAIGRDFCDKLFALERKWKALTPDERKRNRLIYSVPILDAFFSWVESVTTNNGTLKKALGYACNHKKYFYNFLLDGRIPLSNNLSEIAVKPIAITRKNALFSDSVAGAEASAIIFSIINTAQANGLDAYKYLEYLFRKLPNRDLAPGSPALDEYLPWAEQVQKECKSLKKEIYEGETKREPA